MKIEVDVLKYHDWELRHESEVTDDDVAIPSNFGPNLRHVQVLRDGPQVVYVTVPDQDIERMEREHRDAVDLARRGYQTIHEGGALHGQEVTVPPRNLPLKRSRALLAEHLAVAVLPYHAPSEHIVRVRIVDSTLDEVEQAKLERFLNRRLVDEDAVDEEPSEENAEC